MSQPPFSIVVPAHNEENVIARCLDAISEIPDDAEMPEVIVVANGCTDRTAGVAQSIAPWAKVVELAEGSKIKAINEGNRIASSVPRFILDADVVCDWHSLRAVADALLEPGVMVAAPAICVDTQHSSFAVRAYYRVWLRLPYATDAMVGSGIFGVSKEGLARLGTFPDVFGDDYWVRTRFTREERRSVGKDAEGRPVRFVVTAPRTLADLIAIEIRRRIGERHVREKFDPVENGRINGSRQIARIVSNPTDLADLAIYLWVKMASRIGASLREWRRSETSWTRDDSSRQHDGGAKRSGKSAAS